MEIREDDMAGMLLEILPLCSEEFIEIFIGGEQPVSGYSFIIIDVSDENENEILKDLIEAIEKKNISKEDKCSQLSSLIKEEMEVMRQEKEEYKRNRDREFVNKMLYGE